MASLGNVQNNPINIMQTLIKHKKGRLSPFFCVNIQDFISKYLFQFPCVFSCGQYHNP